jgi:hypothetical protein
MEAYFSTQDNRPTPFVTDGLRRYTGSDNPQYIIEKTKAHKPLPKVKVELTSDIKKTFDQTKEEMTSVKRKKKAQAKPQAKRRKTISNKAKAKPQKRSYSKKRPSGQHTKKK